MGSDRCRRIPLSVFWVEAANTACIEVCMHWSHTPVCFHVIVLQRAGNFDTHQRICLSAGITPCARLLTAILFSVDNFIDIFVNHTQEIEVQVVLS